tara:strand:- start:5420 stop:6163 length:744 start_codon:yes stop_codon:yes gene_type:complete
MTTLEFSNEFDIYFNSIATNAAPSIDLYEKSVYLTKAQLEIVKNYFNPKGNKYQTGFEGSTKRRNDLNELLKGAKSSIVIASTNGISDDSQFFRIENETFLIVQEQAKVSSSDKCVDGKYIKVVPKTHDEYEAQKDNPFKKPNKSVIWRLDYYSQQGGSKNIELIPAYTVTEYKYRYIKYPEPIVLTDLNTEFTGEGLSVDGVSIAQTCKLSKSIHREILDRAVELALSDYDPAKLPLKAQLSARNE